MEEGNFCDHGKPVESAHRAFQGILLGGGEWGRYRIEEVFADLIRHGIQIRFFSEGNCRFRESEKAHFLMLAAGRQTAALAEQAGVAVLGVELQARPGDSPTELAGLARPGDPPTELAGLAASDVAPAESACPAAFPGCRYVAQGTDALTYGYCKRVFEREHHIPWEMGRTARCRIREFGMGDLDALYALYAEKGVTEYVAPLQADRRAEAEYQRAYIEHMYGFYGYGMWLVWEREGSGLIGRAGLERRNINGREHLEIGYLVAPRYQRQGYASEICRWILGFAAEHCPGEDVNAFVAKGNRASEALLLKLGFVRKGEEDLKGKIMERYVKSLLF